MKNAVKIKGSSKDAKIVADNKGVGYHGIDEINIVNYIISKSIKIEFIVEGKKSSFRIGNETAKELANAILNVFNGDDE